MELSVRKRLSGKIRARHHATIEVETYLLSGLENNLLAVTDIIKSPGTVLFTKSGVYPIPEKLMLIVKLGDPIATFQDGAYSTSDTIHSRQTSTAEEVYHRKWSTHAHAVKINSRTYVKVKANANETMETSRRELGEAPYPRQN